MSNESNNSKKRRGSSSDMYLLALKMIDANPTESWEQGNFVYNYFRLNDNRASVKTNCFLKATNIITKEERAIEIPASIATGREALNWATSI